MTLNVFQTDSPHTTPHGADFMPVTVRHLLRCLFVITTIVSVSPQASADDWLHWRGPEQNGVSKVVGLTDNFSLAKPGEGNLAWVQPIGGRSAPIVMDGLIYYITALGDGITEGERVMCLKESTGEIVWEKRFGVFHTDIVSSRLGWANMTADPEAGLVYCHGTQGFLYAFAAKTGEIVWEHNLTEEFGRITGYGGRIVSPLCDSGLVILGLMNTSWGDFARPTNRFVAFDSKTGKVVWWADNTNTIGATYYSNPIVAVVNGVRIFIAGGADGELHAYKVRTGEQIWNYKFGRGVINPSPVMDGTLVYCAHGEENPEGGPIGRVICVDAAQIDPKTKRPKLVWEVKNLNRRFGLASPAISEGILYVPSDESELFAFDAKKGGKPLWKFKYGTTSRGAPLICDGKLFVFDVNAKLSILGLNGKAEPDDLNSIPFRTSSGSGFVETQGTPIAVNNKLIFMTREAIYCVNSAKPGPVGAYKPLPAETPLNADAVATELRLFPADVVTNAGGSVSLQVIPMDANGRTVKAPAGVVPVFSFPTPPLPKGAATGPPALKATATVNDMMGTITVEKVPTTQQGYVMVKLGNLTARARLRVAPTIPYMNDFKKIPVGGAPAGWINANGKYIVKELDGKVVLTKVNTNASAFVAKSNTYITLPDSKNYTVQCDVMGTELRGKLPDAGVINSRYNLVLDGKNDPETNSRVLRITAWDARPRIFHSVKFNWEPSVWYTLKFAIEYKEKTAILKGKVWKVGEAEPATWTIEFEDPMPYTEGAAGLYGYVSNISETEPGSEIGYDNLKITLTQPDTNPAKK